MKAALLVALLACAAAITTNNNTDPLSEIETEFRGFITKYGRVYETDAEYARRFEIFQENAAKNAWKNSLKTGATYGVNQFADLSEQEFRNLYLSHIPTADWKPKNVATVRKGAIPTAFDWRTKGAVTHVKNQGQCGSCWAFSTTGNVEGQYFLEKQGRELVSLSEQQLVDCDTVDQGCNGGLPSNAYVYIEKAGGLETETVYPYTAEDGTCQFSQKSTVVKVGNWTALPTDEGELATWLVDNGPISIGINAEWMQTYVGGVSDPLFCDPSSLDHGVLIVGYGVNTDIIGLKTPYWIIKNSWGASWGESGYYLIVRGKGKCGLNTMATSALLVSSAKEL
jgi:cathepsin F